MPLSKIKQYYNIKFPFTSNNTEGFFIDLNRSLKDKVASEIAHVILTQKGTRLRMPNFGTDLMKFIFNQNDSQTWTVVEDEVRKAVTQYVPNAKLNEISVVQSTDNDNTIMLDIMYSVITGNKKENYRMGVKLI